METQKRGVRTTIVIPTTLSRDVYHLLGNLYNNLDDTFQIYLVVDGPHSTEESKDIIQTFKVNFASRGINLFQIDLPESVGQGHHYAPGKKFYSHRAIAGFSQLVNTEFVTFIDQDNLTDPYHFTDLIARLDKYPDLPFAYSYRTIIDKSGRTICFDKCESLGWIPIMGEETNGYLVDTSCWFYRTNFIQRFGSVWNESWGADRRFTMVVRESLQDKEIMERACTRTHSLQYRLGGNEGSVTADFFKRGNMVAETRGVKVNLW